MHDFVMLSRAEVAQREVFDMPPERIIELLEQHEPTVVQEAYRALLTRALCATRSSLIRATDITDHLLGVLIQQVETQIAEGKYHVE